MTALNVFRELLWRHATERRALQDERETMLLHLQAQVDCKADRDDVDARNAELSEQLAHLTARLDHLSVCEETVAPLLQLADNPETQAAYAGLMSLATAIANGHVPFGDYPEICQLLETPVHIPGPLTTSPRQRTTVRLLLRRIAERKLVRT
jgi:hypothetical protein